MYPQGRGFGRGGYQAPYSSGRGYYNQGRGQYQSSYDSSRFFRSYNQDVSTKVFDDGKKTMILDSNNRLKLRSIKWYSKYIQVPVEAYYNDNYASEPAQVKLQIWNKVTSELDEHDFEFTQKVEYLVRHFNLAVEKFEKEQLTADYDAPTTQLWRWRLLSLHDTAFNNVVVPAGGIDNNVRQTARYAHFEVTISPTLSYACTSGRMPIALLPSAEIFRVYVRIPTEFDAATNQEAWVAALTAANYQNFSEIKNASQTAGSPVTIGMLDPTTLNFDTDKFKNKIKQLRAQMIYLLFQHTNKNVFVGTTAQRSLETRLRECTQNRRTVAVYLNEFKEVLGESTEDDRVAGNYRFNAVDMAYNGLDDMIKNYLRDQMFYQVPLIQAMPAVAAQVENINQLSTQAQAAERSLSNMGSAVARINANISNAATRPNKRPATTPSARALVASSQPDFDPLGAFGIANIYGGHDHGHQAAAIPANTRYTTPAQSSQVPTFLAGTTPEPLSIMYGPTQEESHESQIQDTVDTIDQDFNAACLISKAYTADPNEVAECMQSLSILEATADTLGVYLSPAEQAARNASGMNAPSKCWGCGDLDRYKDNCVHHFSKCPHKDDPDVMRAGTNKIVDFRQRMNRRKEDRGTLRQSPRPSSSNWAQTGHPSAKAFQLVAQISNPETPVDVRKNVYVALAKELKGKTPNKTKQTSDKNDEEEYNILMTIPILQAIYRPEAYPIKVSASLPHVALPIGEDEDKSHGIWCCLDSGAGLNIGHLPFFQQLRTDYPEVVSSFKRWEDCTSVDKLSIGGISDKDGLKITHVCYLKTPFTSGGNYIKVAFGLAEKVTCTAILGTPFFKAGGCSINFANSSLYVKAFDRAFELMYFQPGLRELSSTNNAVLSE